MTVNDLFMWYKTTTQYNNLRPNSKIFYDLMMTHASYYIGVLEVSSIGYKEADQLYIDVYNEKENSISRAHAVIRIMTAIWHVAIRNNIVTTNPFTKMGTKKAPPRTDRWTREYVNAFYESSLILNYSVIGIMVYTMYDIVQRPSDIINMKWSNYSEHDAVDQNNNKIKLGVFDFHQKKTGKHIVTPVSEYVRILYTTLPKTDEYMFIAPYSGKQFKTRPFQDAVSRIKKHAGIPENLQVRDLRRTGITEMKENGLSSTIISSVSGNSEAVIDQIYTVLSSKMARSAMEKRYS